MFFLRVLYSYFSSVSLPIHLVLRQCEVQKYNLSCAVERCTQSPVTGGLHLVLDTQESFVRFLT